MKPDRYPLTIIADITNQMNTAKIFTKIDLLKGYFQVPVAKEDIEKSTITTPFSTYTFNYSCFGLRNAGQPSKDLWMNCWATFPSARSLNLTTDTSSTAMGMILEQDKDDSHQPLEFFSKKLMLAGKKYSIFVREILAVHKAIRHFHHMLEGRLFVIQMDHQPLVHALTKMADAWSAQQQRHLSATAEHSYTIQYLKGLAKPMVDALSRNCVNTTQLRIAYPKIAEAQRDDVDLQRPWWDNPSIAWSDLSINNGEMTIACETSTGRPRPYLSEGLRKKAFNLAHNLSHPSGQTITQILAERRVPDNTPPTCPHPRRHSGTSTRLRGVQIPVHHH
ncbi:uncharacterized protein [Macrobrachium rosenbergii]|uniref:uncharacterized protein n=1 Tax=Macrobrachium rosenbergii TaxID=79674 RepID=UPI0034D3B2CA